MPLCSFHFLCVLLLFNIVAALMLVGGAGVTWLVLARSVYNHVSGRGRQTESYTKEDPSTVS